MPEIKHGLGETVLVKEVVPMIDRTYRTWGTREGRALEGYSQGGRGTTRIMFKHPEFFLSVAPGGSDYGPEKTIQENRGYVNETLRFLPLGYNTWDLAAAYAARRDQPALNILLWDGTKCFNYEFNVKYSAYLKQLGIPHEFLVIEGSATPRPAATTRTATTSCGITSGPSRRTDRPRRPPPPKNNPARAASRLPGPRNQATRIAACPLGGADAGPCSIFPRSRFPNRVTVSRSKALVTRKSLTVSVAVRLTSNRPDRTVPELTPRSPAPYP